MTVFFLALSSAFFVGLNQVLIRKGLDSATRTQAIFVSLVVSSSLLWIIAVSTADIRFIAVPAIVFFVLTGLFGPGIARMLTITSLKRIGVSRTIPISGIAPFFASIAAVFFLGETYSLYLFIGLVLIVFGIYILSRKKRSQRGRFDKKDLLIPLAASFFGGLSMVATKKGLLELNEPIVGAALALTTALIVISAYVVATKKVRNLKPTKKMIFPVIAGFSMATAFTLNFSALRIGDVSMVAPVFSTFPLFGVFLSHFILKEQITGRVWIGAVIIIAGVAVIQVF
jgi:drug/metabolite transporter (DMT)-like permease